MEIKEYGHVKPKEIKCNHCGAILEYMYADIKEIPHPNRYIIDCPVCGNAIRKDNDGDLIRKGSWREDLG